MNKFFKAVLAATMFFAITSAGFAAGTVDDAKAMVQKAKAYMKANGSEKSFAEFSNPTGKFVDGDIYLFVYDKSGKVVAHGGNAKLIGKDFIDLKDTDGKPIIRDMLAISAKGPGTYPFKFLNPVTKNIEPKIGYVEMVGDYMVGSGAYAH